MMNALTETHPTEVVEDTKVSKLHALVVLVHGIGVQQARGAHLFCCHGFTAAVA